MKLKRAIANTCCLVALTGSVMAGLAQSSGQSIPQPLPGIVASTQPTEDLTRNLPAQRIGTNDLINISVYGSPEFTRTARISSEGYLRLPMLKGVIKAGGLYPADLELAITQSLVREHILVEPFVTVTIAEYQSRPISITGAVRNPIVLQASRPVTLLEALARAGGLGPEAGSEILITGAPKEGAGSRLNQRIGVRALFDGTEPTANIILSGGEDVRVPSVRKVFVVGNVKQPGAYPVQDEGATTVFEAIALAQGLTPYAANVAYIYRPNTVGGKTEIMVPLKKILRRQSADVALAGSDILYIPDSSGKRATLQTLDKIVTFGSTAGAGALAYGKY